METNFIAEIVANILSTAISTHHQTQGHNLNFLQVTAPSRNDRLSNKDMFEHSDAEDIRENDVEKSRNHAEYLVLKSDYSHRPNVEGMDWANCSWADPDDSLSPVSSKDDVENYCRDSHQ